MQPSIIGVIAVLSGAVYFALHHLSVWWGRRSVRLHLWISGWCLGSILAGTGRLIHYVSSDGAMAVLGMRIATLSIFPLSVMLVGVTRALTNEQRTRWLLPSLGVAATAFTLVGWFTDWLVTDVTHYWSDRIGQSYIWVEPGPAMPLLAVYGLALLGYAIWIMWNSPEARPTRAVFLGGAFIYVAIGFNDLLIGIGRLRSVVLFEYAFIVLAVIFDHISVRRLQQMYVALQKKVEAHTVDIHDTNQKLRLALYDAQSAALAKDQFLANISHEIRTPMNGVVGTAELLARTELSADQSDYVQTLRDSCEAMLVIVNDILDFSKITAGRVVLEQVEFDLLAQVEEVVHLLGTRAYAKGLELTLQIDRNVPRHVVGDPGRYRQVVVNLTSNAIKFTPAGEVRLQLSCDEADDETIIIRCSVADTGIGLTPLQLARVFQPFAQADASTTRRYGGTGLGLPICQQLAHAMSGHIDVRRNATGGMTFSFTAKLGKITEREATSSIHEEMTALVVTDRPPVAAMLSYQLESVAAAVVAATPETLLERVGELPPGDAVVAFVDGGALSEAEMTELCNALGSARRVYVLVPPGKHPESGRRPLGISGFISKPTRRARIAEALLGTAQRPSVPIQQEPMVTEGLVLIAEDNTVNQLVASRMLKSLGFTVEIVEHGRAAVERAQNQPYDIIFMDCQMPEMDGYDATRAIRLADGPNQATPIVALTANAGQDSQRRAVEVGMSDFMSKPVKLAEFQAIMRRWLKTNNAPAPTDLAGSS